MAAAQLVPGISEGSRMTLYTVRAQAPDDIIAASCKRETDQ